MPGIARRTREILRLGANFPALGILGGFAVRHATTLLFTGVVGCVYYFVPNTVVRFRDVWFGAVVTGLLWKGGARGLCHPALRRRVHGGLRPPETVGFGG